MKNRTILVFLIVGILGLIGCSGSDAPQAPVVDNASKSAPDVPNLVIVGGGYGCLGDLVWADLNENGIQDEGEPGIEGVTVYLETCKGELVATTMTDADGIYLFEQVPAGDYQIRFDLPDGYTHTLANQGKDDEVDSDCGVDPVCIKLGDKQIDKSWDCGLIPPVGCRVTGGGVDENGNYNGGTDDGKCDNNRYTFGGEAGAHTGQQPQPYGEWTHNQHTGHYGSFTFHGGTASAIEGTEIDRIECSDPGFCDPARWAPAHQIDFWGVGYFTNIKNSPLEAYVTKGSSLHWFSVNIDDSGEPGKGKKVGQLSCPDDGFGLNGSVDQVDCDCPDFYRITIHETADPASDVIYQVWGYINGNLQIHPPTGYDTNN